MLIMHLYGTVRLNVLVCFNRNRRPIKTSSFLVVLMGLISQQTLWNHALAFSDLENGGYK